MEKLNCMEKYYMGPLSFFVHFYNDALYGKSNNYKFLNDIDNITSSIVSLISVTMLGIKEEMVEMNKDMSFSSKLFISSLEKTVSMIASKKDNKYYIDGYEFLDAATLVNVLRNKLAHGNFYINYKNNRIVLLHENNEIELNIDKLTTFIISAFRNSIKDTESNTYERNFCGFNRVLNKRNKPISSLSEIKDIIRNIRYYSFKLTTEDNVISKIAKDNFESFINYYNKNINTDKTELYKTFKKTEDFFKLLGCNLTMNEKKVATKDIENKLIVYSNRFLINNPNLEYEDQIKLLLQEALKNVNDEYKTFEPLSNNIKLLILLKVFKATGNFYNIEDYLKEQGYKTEISINYDTYATILINLFNTVFMYGYDDVLTKPGGYKLNRSDEFDFKELNFDKLIPSKDGIDYLPYEIAKKEYKKLKSRSHQLEKIIEKRTNQLSNITKKDDKTNITSLINELKSELININNEVYISENKYNQIAKDYTENFKYFKNKAIVNGIRNSIAHGNYEVISGDGIANSKIIFTDLYDGRVTFKIEITFEDFLEMLKQNSAIVLDYVEEKKKKLKRESLFYFK